MILRYGTINRREFVTIASLKSSSDYFLIFERCWRWHYLQHHLQENGYFIHERQGVAPFDERHVHQEATEYEGGGVQVLPLGLVHDWRYHQVSGHQQYDVRDYYRHLIWSGCMRLSTPHNNQCEHSSAVEDPSSEGEEVNQRVYRSVQHHRHCYQGMENQSRSWSETAHMDVR